ncbi:MAG: orotidine-5'-phosphate decarboxylase [Mariniblastus sp.]|nr:orotidine-5'-phosphate decarboxylase [Mariniblastus sp.]
MGQHFADRLMNDVVAKQTPLVVGLDPRWERLPAAFRANGDRGDFVVEAYRQFCCDIIDVVHPLVPAVKPQSAFFEQLGPPGLAALAQVINHAHRYDLQVIMDAKRGDIGSTAEAYASAYLGRKSPWSCDALTVNPYLGADSLQPFVERCHHRGAGLFVLVKTSNPGSQTLQEQVVESGTTVYQQVAQMVEGFNREQPGSKGYGSIGAVVGATYPEQLAELRQSMPHTLFLIPGLGAQGGTAADVAGGFDPQGLGAVVNSSRAIIFAYEREEYSGANDWQAAVQRATEDTIEQLAEGTPAGQLRK